MMNIREYIECKDEDLRHDFEEHIFENVFDLVWSVLPKHNGDDDDMRREHPLWADELEGEIECATEHLADIVANIIEAISGEKEAHTGYYDPREDELDDCVDSRTGWYYVDFD